MYRTLILIKEIQDPQVNPRLGLRNGPLDYIIKQTAETCHSKLARSHYSLFVILGLDAASGQVVREGDVPDEVVLHTSAVGAMKTGEGLLARVHAKVDLEVLLLRCPVTAEGAGVGPLPAVGPQMTLHVTSYGRLVRTQRTLQVA